MTTLFDAMKVLARVHTLEDERTGFAVEMAPTLSMRCAGVTEPEYVDAWAVVRRELGWPYGPEDTGGTSE